MATKPSKKPRWATNDIINGVSLQPNVYEPTEAKKDLGIDFDESPFRQYMNWLGRLTNDWIDWFDQEVDANTTQIALNVTAIGDNATDIGDNATQIGLNVTAIGDNSTAIGINITNIGNNATDIGNNTTAIGNNAIDIGNNATQIGLNVTAIGDNATDIGDNATQIGLNVTAIGNNATDIGNNTTAIGNNATQIGLNVTAIGDNATDIGDNATQIGLNVTAIGNNATDITTIFSNLAGFKYREGSFTFVSSEIPGSSLTGNWTRTDRICMVQLPEKTGTLSATEPLVTIKPPSGDWHLSMQPFGGSQNVPVVITHNNHRLPGMFTITNSTIQLWWYDKDTPNFKVIPNDWYGSCGFEALTITYRAANAL